MRLPKLPPRKVAAIPLSVEDGALAHMAASILLDYPSVERRARFAAVTESVTLLPDPLRRAFESFLNAASAMGQQELEVHFTATFDLKRKCCPYLSYYAAGDTRRRGASSRRIARPAGRLRRTSCPTTSRWCLNSRR